MTILRLTKMEAAQRQLDTALELYFSSGDLVAVWTLGAAAYNLLRDLGRTSNSKPMLFKEQLPAMVPPDRRNLLIKDIQETENFLKHADRDSDAVLDFRPNGGRIELLLFDAALKYLELSGTETPMMALIRMWFLSNATIEHDGDESFDRWLETIKPQQGESPREYRDRMWSEASRLANGIAAEQGGTTSSSLPRS